MAKNMRQKVVEEILATEATYLRQLEILDKFFVQPSREKGILPPTVHHTVFGGLVALQEVSRELYQALLPGKDAKEEEEKDVGQIFLQLAPFLKAYSTYVKNYQGALDMLMECEGRISSVRQWVEATEGRPEVQTKLPALLITPVQRIPRYLLLLSQLLHHTPPHHPHQHSIAKAVEEVEGVARFVDGSISEAENYQRVLMIQRALKGGRPTIMAPGRWLVKEGLLHKMARNGSSSHPRLFFLFSDVLMYTKLPPGASPLTHTHRDITTTAPPPPPPPTPQPPPASPSTATSDYRPNSLDFCCVLPLRHCVVIPLLGSGARELFRIKCESEDLLLYSSEEAGGGGGEWVAALKKAVEQAVRKRRTLRKDSTSRKPIRRQDLKRAGVENHPASTSTTTTTTTTTSTSTSTKSPCPSLVKILHHLPPSCASWLSPKRWKSGTNPTTTTTTITTTATTTTTITTATSPLSSIVKSPKSTNLSTCRSPFSSSTKSEKLSSTSYASTSSYSYSTPTRLVSTNASLPSTSYKPNVAVSSTSSTFSTSFTPNRSVFTNVSLPSTSCEPKIIISSTSSTPYSSSSTFSISSTQSTPTRHVHTNAALPSTSYEPKIINSSTSSTPYSFSSTYSTYSTPPKHASTPAANSTTIAISSTLNTANITSSSSTYSTFSTFSPPRPVSTTTITTLSSTSTKSLKIASPTTSTVSTFSTRPVSTPADYFTSTSSSSPYFNPYSSTSPPFSTLFPSSPSSTSSSTSNHTKRGKRPRDLPQSGEDRRKRIRRPFSLLQSP
ncbi:uncharacterized protein LOC135095646 [Scylla paramamosain]|uniref:uncharacterized protein LOC135095646 n=1 Tax=Scylla paramamosain TaxID=85552 RepID=UPI0030836A12